jgi:hypothetical protein
MQGVQQACKLRIYVAQGKQGESLALWLDGNHLSRCFHIVDKIAVGEHNALGLPGGAGSIHKLSQVLTLDLRLLENSLTMPEEGG